MSGGGKRGKIVRDLPQAQKGNSYLLPMEYSSTGLAAL
jgi:hypothetical protein